jgi:hypothetical protein
VSELFGWRAVAAATAAAYEEVIAAAGHPVGVPTQEVLSADR